MTTPPDKNPVFERWKEENPEAAEAFVKFYKLAAGAEQKALDPKTRQLIYIAVLTASRYAPAVKAHIDQALSAGATKEEVKAAIMAAIPAIGLANVLPVYGEVADLLK